MIPHAYMAALDANGNMVHPFNEQAAGGELIALFVLLFIFFVVSAAIFRRW